MRELSRAAIVVFWKVHEGQLVQSPGSEASTRRALDFVPDLPSRERIADLGCGTGRQTFALARMTRGHITAADVLPNFVDDLKARAESLGFADRIDARVASMLEVPPEPPGYDLIWCEGAVYNVGFETALRTWRDWLAPGGCIGVSEATWLVADPPRAAREFWQAEYPPMQQHDANLACIARCGYELLGTFPLPASDWLDEYYDPIDARIEEMREGERDPEMLAALDDAAAEARLYRESDGAYGYVFYVIRPR